MMRSANRCSSSAIPLLQQGIGPGAGEVGVGLQNMQVRIHGFLLVGVFGAQAQVSQRRPVAGQGLQVAAVRGVVAVLLDAMKQRPRRRQRPRLLRCQVVFRQAVDGEGQRVHLLFGVQRLAPVVHGPVHAAELRVQEVGQQVVESAGCQREVVGLPGGVVGGRERPQDAGVQHRAFRGAGRGVVVVVDFPRKPPNSSSGAWVRQ